jgi:hypothetical protein
MSQVMKMDEALNPVAIRSFRPQTVMLQAQDVARLIQQLFALAPWVARDAEVDAMRLLLVTGLAKRNRIIQILSAINYRFLGPNSC